MALSDKDRLRAYLKKYADGIYKNSIVEFIPETGGYLIGVPSEISPFSGRARDMMKRRVLIDLKLDATIIQFPSEKNAIIGAALSPILELVFQEHYLDSIIYFHSKLRAEVVVILKSINNDVSSCFQSARRKTEDFLKGYNIDLNQIFFHELLGSLPSLFQILRKVYVLSPTSLATLQTALLAEGCTLPSEHWLRRQMDNLSKKHLIVGDQGFYAMTAAGMSALPPSSGKSSPDILRALELARKRW